ncbi:cell division cycle 7-related protein kinase-like [Planoprotostelium fungivorum]|uniref:non-specific serine/threonine protein kinase n=1 Tax=Planoprotostelium fungivorum TaxID=1890364 RepID=A0A2P6NPS0_9EUKA|nr:cell division cycle 7-related protein kinase-like [Planoprotostelium fungivorum]
MVEPADQRWAEIPGIIHADDELAFNSRIDMHNCSAPHMTSSSGHEASFELQTNSALNASFEEPRSQTSVLSAHHLILPSEIHTPRDVTPSESMLDEVATGKTLNTMRALPLPAEPFTDRLVTDASIPRRTSSKGFGGPKLAVNGKMWNESDDNAKITAASRVDFSLDTFKEVGNRYQIIEKIGEGTFSSVYKALPLKQRPQGMPEEDTYVAIKRIYPTCSPARIINEMKHLRGTGGCHYVLSMFDALRHEDQVSLVVPYVPHDKFKDFVLSMTLPQIKSYMRALFMSLDHLHAKGILHRDVKPGNFLCNFKENRFMLVDFGLAELAPNHRHLPVSTTRQKVSGTVQKDVHTNGQKRKLEDIPSMSMTKKPKLNEQKAPAEVENVALPENSWLRRKSRVMHAPRAGTRGFRAPEILLKFQRQTTAIDVWSAGVIFLCVLSGRYPFFNSPDDLASLAEIAAVFGTEKLKRLGMILGRKVTFPIDVEATDLRVLCESLNRERSYKLPDSAFDLLGKCMELNFERRITCADALRHPFLNEE